MSQIKREGEVNWEISPGAAAASSMKLKPSDGATRKILSVHIPK